MDEIIAMALAVAALAATAVAASAALRFRSPVSFLVSLYVVGSAEVVVLTEVLSLFDGVGAAGYAAGEGILLALALGAWVVRGRPLPPFRRVALLAEARRHPLVAFLALLVAGSVVFQAFLVLATPPNNPDAMAYHLPRAAEWYQRGAVERFDVYDERFNAFPPNAEMQVVYGFAFLGEDTLAAAPQFLARLALLLAVYGLARRAGFARAPAAFATLVCSSLTLVVVQAVTTQTDLVTAAFVASAAFLVLEALLQDARAGPLAGLAAGLAVGTKWTGAAAVPVLALLALAATREPLRLARLAAWGTLGAVAVGISSYARNLAATGHLLGETSEVGGLATGVGFSRVATRFVKIVLDFGDFSSYFHNANEDTSYFGTLGWAVILPLSAGFGLAWLLRRTTPVRGALAWAIPIVLVVVAYSHPYNRFEGRLMITPVAISAALVAWTYARAWVTRVVALMAATTLVLALVFNEAKPVGLAGSRPVWELPRMRAMMLKEPELDAVFSQFDARVPPDAGDIGAVVGASPYLYPLFGPTLARRLSYLRPQGALARAEQLDLAWVVITDRRLSEGERSGWRLTSLGGPTGWILAERAGA